MSEIEDTNCADLNSLEQKEIALAARPVLSIETNVIGAFEIVKDVFNNSARTSSLDRNKCQHCARNLSPQEFQAAVQNLSQLDDNDE